MTSLTQCEPTELLGSSETSSFPPGALPDQDTTPPPSRDTALSRVDIAPEDRAESLEGAPAERDADIAGPTELGDIYTLGSERNPTASTTHDAEAVPEQSMSLLCMPAPPVTTPPRVVEWASVQAIVRRRLRTYNPLEVDEAVGNIMVDRSKIASGTITESAFSEVIDAVYKDASDLDKANEFAMLMHGAVELDPAKKLIPGLQQHVKNLPLYGRIAGASVAWVLQQIESEDVSEVIGMCLPTTARNGL